MKRIEEDDMEEGEFEEDVYTKEGRKKLIEEDEIDASEAGFIEGYENKNLATCNNCGKTLTDEDEKDIIEEEINEKKHIFCCRECRDQYNAKEKA